MPKEISQLFFPELFVLCYWSGARSNSLSQLHWSREKGCKNLSVCTRFLRTKDDARPQKGETKLFFFARIRFSLLLLWKRNEERKKATKVFRAESAFVCREAVGTALFACLCIYVNDWVWLPIYLLKLEISEKSKIFSPQLFSPVFSWSRELN